MATTKKRKEAVPTDAHGAPPSASYEAALTDYAGALELMRAGRLEEARERFASIPRAYPDEPELADRAVTHARICERRLRPGTDDAASAADCYHRGVYLLNSGDYAGAMRLLDRAIEADPMAPSYLYARASVWALQGKTSAAVTDLSQAIAADGKLRFQASNDPDFERIREEPAFIDIIEPTPSGA